MSDMNNNTNFDSINEITSEDEIEVVFKAFDVSETTDIHLGENGFKKDGEPSNVIYVYKVTNASILYIGDNSKFVSDKSKQYNNLIITISNKKKSANLSALLDETNKTSLPYKLDQKGNPQFKVILNSDTVFVDNNKKPIKINLQKVPCYDLLDYKGAAIDIVLTGTSNEFVGKNGETFLYATLSACQIMIKKPKTAAMFDFL